MIVKEKTTQQIEKTTDVTCDWCRESCKKRENPDIYEYGNFRACWGYDSNHDTELWDSDLCEGCCEKIKEFIESNGGTVHVDNYM